MVNFSILFNNKKFDLEYEILKQTDTESKYRIHSNYDELNVLLEFPFDFLDTDKDGDRSIARFMPYETKLKTKELIEEIINSVLFSEQERKK